MKIYGRICDCYSLSVSLSFGVDFFSTRFHIDSTHSTNPQPFFYLNEEEEKKEEEDEERKKKQSDGMNEV